jgi:NADH:ubiquinone oxidoreductase subunit 2 (subunit N)
LIVVKEAYLGKPAEEKSLHVDIKTRALSYATIVSLVILGIFPTALIQWIQEAIK